MMNYGLMIFYSTLGTSHFPPWRSHIHMQCFHILRVSVPLAYSEDMRPSTKCWEKSLRSKVFHRAELLDGTRDSVFPAPLARAHWLALKNMQCFHMLRRCVGFSWRSPCVTKSATHLLVFIVLFPTCSPFLVYLVYFVVSKSTFKTTIAFLRLKKAYFEKAY